DDHDGKLKRDVFLKLDVGTSEEELIRLFGEPKRFTPKRPTTTYDDHLEWKEGTRSVTVYTLRKQLAFKGNNQGWSNWLPSKGPEPEPPRVNRKVTQKNYEAIARGMTIRELEELLGEPDTVDTHVLTGEPNRLVWKGSSTVEVGLRDGKAFSK